MTDLNVPQYDAKANSNFYIGVTGGSVIGYKNSGATIPIAGGTVGYEYKDKDNGGFHAGASITVGTTFTGKADLGYEFRWGDYGLDLSAKASGTRNNIANKIDVDNKAYAEVLLQYDNKEELYSAKSATSLQAKYNKFDYNAGVSGSFVYHGKTKNTNYNIGAGIEAGYHAAGPSVDIHIEDRANVIVNIENATIEGTGTSKTANAELSNGSTNVVTQSNSNVVFGNDVISAYSVSTTDVKVNGQRRNPWYVTPTLKADLTFGKNKSWTVKLDANMYEATAGIVYNIPVGKNK